MTCVFENCHFKTNIYGTFASHKTRKDTPHSLDEFKAGKISEDPENHGTSEGA